ncbi:hypothetical protein [Pseudoduganella albidiflava]|uniref:Transmembrane protein n=1 Tax=Pseudoduganella albidiflava TaxID=321983 RepID=A0A411X3U7_9BURK|nr:hypothetical protein [Pseudoduganella albidiflava]QBI03697.1 hypothetical protein EYF70_24830 [Pseudoduganella albidiflava]GGY69619.1 hypothetical protein GCM10007387_59490 [Pseudoduganella albidiflava]
MRLSFSIPVAVALATVVSACSPKFDWRDYRAADAPYSVLFPAKPATHTRTVSLDGREASMTMTAAEVDGTMFAVGSATLADATQAEQAVRSMRTAMVRNIGGNVSKEAVRDSGIDIEAHGASNGRPMELHGRFVARDKRAYQVIVIGPEKAVDAENIDMFLRSFKLN